MKDAQTPLREIVGRKLFAMFSGPAWGLWSDWTADKHEHWFTHADAILALIGREGRDRLLLAISEVHSGNQAEGEKIVDAVLGALRGQRP